VNVRKQRLFRQDVSPQHQYNHQNNQPTKANLHILAFTPRLLRGRVAVYFEIYDSKGQFVKGRRSQGFCSYFGNEVALGFIVIPVVFHSLFMFIIWNKVK